MTMRLSTEKKLPRNKKSPPAVVWAATPFTIYCFTRTGRNRDWLLVMSGKLVVADYLPGVFGFLTTAQERKKKTFLVSF